MKLSGSSSKYGEKLDPNLPHGLASPAVRKSLEKDPPTARNPTKRRSHLKKLRTEDFSLRRKLMNRSIFGKCKVIYKSAQQYIYLLLEDPQSSILALIIQYLLLLNILLSCAAIITDSILDATEPNYTLYASYLELYLFIFFALEYILRLVSCTAFESNLLAFLISPSNLVDLIAILPFLLSLTMENTSFQQLKVIRMVRFLRIFRIFKVSRYLKDTALLVDTVKNSAKDIAILLCVLGVLVLIFATGLFYAELNQEPGPDDLAILSITEGIWWCITTMTTVGYGDKVPMTIQGKFVACFAALFGITSISLPVAVMGMNLTQTLRNHEENVQIQALKDALNKKTDITMSRDGAPETARNTQDYNLNLRQLAFMEERLRQVLENNEKVMRYVQKSQQLFDEVTQDLMSLYSALAEEMDLHLEEKLKNLKAKHKIMKMEKNVVQKKSIEINQIVSLYKEKHRMMSQMSILNCEESQAEDRSAYSRKQSVKASITLSRNGGVAKTLKSKFPFSSQQEMQIDKSFDLNNSMNVGKKNSYNENSILDNIGNNVGFQFDLRQSSGEIDGDDDQCDVNGKMKSLSQISEKLKRINSIRQA